MAAVFLIALATYLGCGLLFAIPFVMIGVKRIDPHTARPTLGFRLLVFPGSMALWPLLLRRWLKGAHEPPEEYTAHRSASKATAP
jgi:hypothetical protein